MYPPELVKPMQQELTAVGFNELRSKADVDMALAKEGQLWLWSIQFAVVLRQTLDPEL